MHADLLEYFQKDILDLIRGDMSPVEAFSLLMHLPDESRVKAHFRGGSHHEGWGYDRYLRAGMINAINTNTYLLARINSKRKPDQPEPVETPDLIDKKKERQKNQNNPFAQRVFYELDKLKE